MCNVSVFSKDNICVFQPRSFKKFPLKIIFLYVYCMLSCTLIYSCSVILWSYFATVIFLFSFRFCIFFSFVLFILFYFSNNLRERNLHFSYIVFSVVIFYFIKMSIMDMIESFSSKLEKFMDENIMYYAPLNIFLLHYFISLNFKLVEHCWKVFSLI